jgi:hypothetical protein
VYNKNSLLQRGLKDTKREPLDLLYYDVHTISRLFRAQMALASLMPFQGPKKSRFSGPTPSNAPHNDIAPLKTITYRAIKTTGTLIVIRWDLAEWYLYM